MCGIFGITGFNKKDSRRAQSALHTMAHRGPDQWSEYKSEYVYFGHRRLSILDLSENGRQPMISDDRNIVIIVNGEIYNYKHLKRELQNKYHFKSVSDSEILIHGYREWGIDKLLNKMEGMYAFSIYDRKENLVYIARDRVGIKPLYYSTIKNEIVFASELKAIVEYYKQDLPELDYSALYDFLTYRYIPAPKTMYKNVHKLLPAHVLKINLHDGSFEHRKYWSLDVFNNGDDPIAAQNKIREMVFNSVNEQMMSDVPVGFFLSGGIDSSTVVATAAQMKKTLNTFSIGFSDKSHDETHYADIIAEKYQTNHQKRILDESLTKNLLTNMKPWFDEPFGDSSAFPTYLVSKFAKEAATVVLTGDGGDEVFGGYNWYNLFKQKSAYRFSSLSFLASALPNYYNKQHLLAKVIRKIEYPHMLTDLELYVRLMSGYLKKQKKTYKTAWEIPNDYDDYWNFRKYYRDDLDLYTRLQFLDFHTYLPDDILTKVDRVSMAVSLESRVPLLSTPLIEYSFSLPENIRLLNGDLKGIMKESFRDLLPDEILNREKKGFSTPMHNWNSTLLGKTSNFGEYVLHNCFGIERP